ncbi:MAG: hypothetical protein H7Z41_16850, partial [Cytophagales bacterium]|nr:hypothetical protein [Armatimonadota bacterium]
RVRGEKKALKRDPMAQLLALDALPEIAAPPASDGFGGVRGNGGGWAAPVQTTSPYAPLLPLPDSKAVREASSPPSDDFRVARNASAAADSSPAYQGSAYPAHSAASSSGEGYGGGPDTTAAARRAVALENPLVQETLQIFGGEIVEE